MRALRAAASLLAGVAITSVSPAALAAGPTEPPKASEPAAPAPSPASDPVAEAAAHFRRGVELYKEGDGGGALVEFKRTYDLAPNYRVLYNLGQTYYQLQRYADALTTLQAFLDQGGVQIPPDRRASVEADVRALENRVGVIEIRSNVEGAQILIDDEAVGTAPLAQPVRVSLGHRKVTATKDGQPSQERFLDVAAGDHPVVMLEFPTATPAVASVLAPAPVASAPPDAPSPSPSRTGTWVAWSITGALGAATAVTGILALASKSDLSTQLGSFPGNAAAIDQARARTKTFGVLCDALLGATVVAGGIAVYVTLTARAHASAEVAVGPSGIALRGRY